MLKKEREQSTFDVREMTHFLNCGKEWTELLEKAGLMLQRDPYLFKKNFFDLTKKENLEKTIEQTKRYSHILQVISKKDPLLNKALDHMINEYDRSFQMKTYVHVKLFYETIWSQGTEEQFKKWEEKILKWDVVGCFAMTELGHSSFLRGLETTATFDLENDEFVINSPTLTSTKWWIGMAGYSATHTVALCQVYSQGKNCGIHWLIVPLRDVKTGQLMPGVTCGSLGSKMGRDGLDNGWIQFSSVRIPKDNFLSRWAQVDSKTGDFHPSANPALSYLTLIGERILALPAVVSHTSQCITIAVRYGAFRQQGENNQQILDFQTHQYNLMPIIANTYIFKIVSTKLLSNWEETLKLQNDPKGKFKFFSLIQDFHAVSACLKANGGYWGTEALELCRRSMGGHAYSAYNAIAGHIGDYGVITTGGGDNIVLAQQHGRYLFSAYKKALKDKKILGSCSFLNHHKVICENSKFKANSKDEVVNLDYQMKAFQYLTIKSLDTLLKKVNVDLKCGKKNDEIWNNHMMELIDISKIHFYCFCFESFNETFKLINDTRLKNALQDLFILFGLKGLEVNLSFLLQYEFVSNEQVNWIKNQVILYCKKIRINAVSLVDAFHHPDFVIKSPLGKYEPSYEEYFKMINESNSNMKINYWEKEIKPLTSKI